MTAQKVGNTTQKNVNAELSPRRRVQITGCAASIVISIRGLYILFLNRPQSKKSRCRRISYPSAKSMRADKVFISREIHLIGGLRRSLWVAW